MNRIPKQLISRGGRKSLGGGLLLGLFLFVLAMVHFEALHSALHCDAPEADHQCVVTLFASGQVDSAANAVSISIVLAESTVSVLADAPFLFSSDDFVLPNRGPPSFC